MVTLNQETQNLIKQHWKLPSSSLGLGGKASNIRVTAQHHFGWSNIKCIENTLGKTREGSSKGSCEQTMPGGWGLTARSPGWRTASHLGQRAEDTAQDWEGRQTETFSLHVGLTSPNSSPDSPCLLQNRERCYLKYLNSPEWVKAAEAN